MKSERAILSSLPPAAATHSGPASASPPLAALERAAAHRLLAAVPGAPFSIVLPHGEEVRAGSAAPAARLCFGDARALLALFGPSAEICFGDAYSDGRIEIEGDLQAALDAVWAAPPRDGLVARAGAAWRRLCRRRNSLRRSRANVQHHYDLGNEFYALWLDRELVYTCAYFPRPDATLEEAQLAKLEHVARKLRLRPDETVFEAGCGWGSLALHLARRHGARVRAFNISAEQIAWARERARAEGLAGRVEFVEDDYRNVSGRCDAFVSVGMLEHVGPGHYRDLGRVLDRCLVADGRGLLHFVGRNQPREFSPWMDRRIFPGAHAPTLREVADVLEPADLSVLDVENLRLHYARTLEHWLERFERQRGEVARRFDERFVRTWRLYLAGSIASFRTGWLQLFQVLFARGGTNRVPWTRDDLYSGA